MRTKTAIATAVAWVVVAIGAMALIAVKATAEPETKIEFVPTTTTVTARTTTTLTTTAPPVTVTEIPAPVTETVTEAPAPVTVTETVTTTEAAPLAEAEPADWTSSCLGNWIPRPGLIAEGFYALTKNDGSHILYDPETPTYLRQYSCLHESFHVRQARAYGDVQNTPGNPEKVADCGSVLTGWLGDLRYGCDPVSMATARDILNG